jgi:thioredoxin 1
MAAPMNANDRADERAWLADQREDRADRGITGSAERRRVDMSGKNLHEFTTDNFDREVLHCDKTVLVDFTSKHIGPCKALAPIIEKVADEFEGKIVVGKLDIDTSRPVAEKYRIRSVPTVMVFRGGHKTGEHIGLTTRDKLVKLLDLKLDH